MTRSSSKWNVSENRNKNLLARLTGGDIAASSAVGGGAAGFLVNDQLGAGNKILRESEDALREKATSMDKAYKKTHGKQGRLARWFLRKKGVPDEINLGKSVPKYSLSKSQVRAIAGKTGLKAGAGIAAALLAARFVAQKRVPGTKELGIDTLASKLDSNYMDKRSSVNVSLVSGMKAASASLFDDLLSSNAG